jgi:AcrR family transcriptional regulator
MARTQAADYGARREEIVSRAAALYAQRGFLGATVLDLAQACSVSKSAIYHYYPSKEDILFDVMHSHVTALDGAARGVMAGSAPAKAKLRQLARAFMALYVGAADRHKVLLNELDHLPAARREEIVGLQRGLIEMFERVLIEIEPGLTARPGILRPAVMIFFGMINWTHTWFDPTGALTAQALADMAVDLTLGGLAKTVNP